MIPLLNPDLSNPWLDIQEERLHGTADIGCSFL